MGNKPYGVDQENRVPVPDGAKSLGTEANNGIFNEYMNQILFESQCDHIWGNQAQVTVDPATATFYTDGSGNPLNAVAGAVTINTDDKILIRHNTTQAAALLLDAGGKRITLEMYGGVTLNMNTYNLTIGGTGDEISGSIDLIGTGTLTVEKSNGLRVSHTAMTVVNSDGDIIDNNSNNTAIDWEAVDLVLSGITNTTIDVDATSISVVDTNDLIKIIPTLNLTIDITASGANGLDTGSEASSTIYYIWVIAKSDGTAAGLLSLSSTAPTLPAEYTFKAMVGRIYNNVSDNLTNPILAKGDHQYLGDGTDFTVTGTNSWTTVEAFAILYRASDGSPRIRFNFSGTVSSSQTTTLTVSGVNFGTNAQSISASQGIATSIALTISETNAGASGTILLSWAASGITSLRCAGDISIAAWPSWGF